ncbi:MAG: hypothetical protein IT352_11035 [Gemmatimonadales bacterium]|nr:hypothetical protein [Gemmatimonadales bacterium]
MSIRSLAALAAVAALTAASSFNLLILSTSSETTVAGGSGTDSRLVGTGGNYQGLYKILWAEDANIPCYFRVYSRHLNQDGSQQDEANLGASSCDETSNSERSAGFNTPGMYVNGIAVCRNNQRIKGIKLHYADVGPNGTVTPQNQFDQGTQPNCTLSGYLGETQGTWSASRMCPTGMIANQIRVHFRPENPIGFTTAIKQSATGISLLCRRVEVKS